MRFPGLLHVTAPRPPGHNSGSPVDSRGHGGGAALSLEAELPSRASVRPPVATLTCWRRPVRPGPPPLPQGPGVLQGARDIRLG